MESNLLISGLWPVVARSGARQRLTISQILDARDDPIIRPDFGRADLDAGFYEFLIALFATGFTPRDTSEWQKLVSDPPSGADLLASLEDWHQVFELMDGDRRFMQDMSLDVDAPASPDGLFLDAPGANTIKNNADHFVKRGRFSALDPSVAALALYIRQSMTSGGGQGYLTGPRGGGPLTTLVVGKTLLRTVAFNVPDVEEFYEQEYGCNALTGRIEDVFPWMADGVFKKERGGKLRPGDVDVRQIFWPMARRYRLVFGDSPATCSVTGVETETPVIGIVSASNGVDYSEEWKHPLSPYSHDARGKKFPVCYHVNPPGIDYGDWLGVAVSERDEDGKPKKSGTVVHPAHTVSVMKERRIRKLRKMAASEASAPLRIWAFGYDMDNDKARAFASAMMPFYVVAPDWREEFEVNATRLIRSAAYVRERAAFAIAEARYAQWKELSSKTAKKAFSGIQKNADIDVREQILVQTELQFYEALKSLAEAGVTTNPLECAVTVRENWCKLISHSALCAFEYGTENQPLSQSNLERIAGAKRRLVSSLRGSKLRSTILQLPSRYSERDAA